MKTSEDIVNESGYPLQIYLENLVKEQDKDKDFIWRFQQSEHRWIDEHSKEEGFIDLVLKNKRGNYRIIIECKRITGKWNFIVQEQAQEITYDSKILRVDYQTLNYSWPNFHLKPASYEAAYCVMETEGKRDTRSLEKISGELLLSLEYLAIDETEFLVKTFPEKNPLLDNEICYVPLIVTTADLQLFTFNPKDFDIKTGKIIKSSGESVQYIRFKKNLSSHIKFENLGKNYDYSKENKEFDRTVFIVHAEYLIEFLKSFGSF
jgi:hypothetical protein